jgi:hypothetical protein
MYRDYAISPDLFHWESQNSTTVASETGLRYLHHRERGTHVALFVREAPTDGLGVCSYEEHTGERPITITWRLRRPMPVTLVLAPTVSLASGFRWSVWRRRRQHQARASHYRRRGHRPP